jgi:hypothetical protein
VQADLFDHLIKIYGENMDVRLMTETQVLRALAYLADAGIYDDIKAILEYRGTVPLPLTSIDRGDAVHVTFCFLNRAELAVMRTYFQYWPEDLTWDELMTGWRNGPTEQGERFSLKSLNLAGAGVVSKFPDFTVFLEGERARMTAVIEESGGSL